MCIHIGSAFDVTASMLDEEPVPIPSQLELKLEQANVDCRVNLKPTGVRNPAGVRNIIPVGGRQRRAIGC